MQDLRDLADVGDKDTDDPDDALSDMRDLAGGPAVHARGGSKLLPKAKVSKAPSSKSAPTADSAHEDLSEDDDEGGRYDFEAGLHGSIVSELQGPSKSRAQPDDDEKDGDEQRCQGASSSSASVPDDAVVQGLVAPPPPMPISSAASSSSSSSPNSGFDNEAMDALLSRAPGRWTRVLRPGGTGSDDWIGEIQVLGFAKYTAVARCRIPGHKHTGKDKCARMRACKISENPAKPEQVLARWLVDGMSLSEAGHRGLPNN